MALSKRREKAYRDILGEGYLYPIRSIFEASPGTVLVEADYQGAELFMMAVQSGDPVMIDHCLRGQLSTKDPNYYDIHSNIAIKAFKLNCPPTKKGLEAAGLPHIRDVTKCVVAGSRLLTNKGWFRVEELCGHLSHDEAVPYQGDLQMVTDEGMVPLTGLYHGPVRRCIRVVTTDGHEVTGTTEHKFRSVDSAGNLIWVRSADLKPGDWVVAYDGSMVDVDQSYQNNASPFPAWSTNYRTNFKPLIVLPTITEDWAAFLGLYLSEGAILRNKTSRDFAVSLADEKTPEFADKTEALLKRLFSDRLRIGVRYFEKHQRQRTFRVSSSQLSDWLLNLCPGYASVKKVPDVVFQWPNHLVCVFLRWLFEGDGTAKKNGNGFTLQYATSSQELAAGVQILLDGLGIVSRRYAGTRQDRDGNYWVVEIRTSSHARFLDQIGFVTEEKQGRCVSTVGHKYDDSTYPNQQGSLQAVFPYLRGLALEKCRECLRTNQTVRLNRTRLSLIVESLPADLPKDARKAAMHLRNLLALRGRFVEVEIAENAGDQEVFDVESGNHHLIINGLSCHNTVVFGVPYGRGDEAVVRAIAEEGTLISAADAAKIRAAILDTYPRLGEYLEEARKRVVQPGWIRNCFGSYRRFTKSNLAQDDGSLEREAGNYNIQSGVADALSRALDYLVHYPGRRRSDGSLRFRLLLPIHDAILFEVPIEELEWFVGAGEGKHGVLQECMTDKITIYPCDFNGQRLPGRDGLHMGVEYSLFLNWGEAMSRDAGLAIGVPERFLPPAPQAA
jgi:intein/homing endonuclease